MHVEVESFVVLDGGGGNSSLLPSCSFRHTDINGFILLEINARSVVRNTLVDKGSKVVVREQRISGLLITHFQMLASMAGAGLSGDDKDVQAAYS